MSTILDEIEQAAQLGPHALDRFVRSATFPRVEGRRVTFLYQGDGQEVTLQHWIHGLPPSLAFRRVHMSDVFVLQVDLPPGSRMEYKIGVQVYGRTALIRDPLNPQTARDPFGSNSVVYGEGYRPPEWSTEDPDARPGTIEDRIASIIQNKKKLSGALIEESPLGLKAFSRDELLQLLNPVI